MEDSPSIKSQNMILGFEGADTVFRSYAEKMKRLKPFMVKQKSQKKKKVSPERSYAEKAFPLRYLWPVKSETDTPGSPSDASLIGELAHTPPEYDDDIKETVLEFEKSYPFENGNSVDILSLLAGGGADAPAAVLSLLPSNDANAPAMYDQDGNSVDVLPLSAMVGGHYLHRNNGELVQVDQNTFRGKYILICCFHVPFKHKGYDSSCLQALATTCSELYATRNDVEIIVVAKMNKLANYEALFYHFLLGFPSSCLVVPFNDSKRRDFICYYLRIRDCLDCIQCVLLDNKGKDNNNNNNNKDRHILFSGFPGFAMDHGAEAFPFTDEKLEEMNTMYYPGWKTALTSQLEGLLGCTPSDVLKNINPAGAGARDQEITISELKENVVGLYLCKQGNLVGTIQDICQQCRSKQLPFQVVLVYLPFVGALDPQVCIRNIDEKLKQHNLSCCWRLPFNNSVSRRLHTLMCNPARDKLVIVGANNSFVEPYGGKVYRDLGIDAFPFSREGLIQRELDKVKEHTLESLLVYGSRNYVLQGNNKIAVSELRGRNVLLYYDSLADEELFDQVLYWYYEIKANDPFFELVFVRRNTTAVLEDDSDLIASMPWLVCPYDPAHSAFLQKKFFTEGIEFVEPLIEFGKNGRMCSFRIKKKLTRHGPEGFPFGDSHLRRDVIEYLCRCFKFMQTSEYLVFVYNIGDLAL